MSTAGFRVSVWCRDCCGQDDQGCFEGSSELLHSRKHPWDVLTFADLDAAKAAGYDAISQAPYEFAVLDHNDNEVFDSSGTCQVCGYEGWTENANLSGEYRRDLNDFLEMCKSCHATYDERERNFARPAVG